MLPCQGNFCNLGVVSTLPLWDHDRKGEWRDCVEVGKEDDTETSLFLIVRPGLKDFLVKMSTEAQMGLRSFVQRAVVQKVRSLKFMPHEIRNVIFNHCRLTMAMRLIGCLN